MNDFNWSKKEKKIARKAFDMAYERECSDFAEKIRSEADKLTKPEDIWNLHDFMSKKMKDIGKTYDYRYSVLILVFARLINEGWLDYDDLNGLADKKIDRIKAIIDFWKE
jgi:hypothetical protein